MQIQLTHITCRAGNRSDFSSFSNTPSYPGLVYPAFASHAIQIFASMNTLGHHTTYPNPSASPQTAALPARLVQQLHHKGRSHGGFRKRPSAVTAAKKGNSSSDGEVWRQLGQMADKYIVGASTPVNHSSGRLVILHSPLVCFQCSRVRSTYFSQLL